MDEYEARTNLTEEYEEGKSLTGMSMKWVNFTFDRDKYQLLLFVASPLSTQH
jgi:hypothetical protein